MKLRDLVPNLYIHVSVSDLHTVLPRSTYFAVLRLRTDHENMYKSFTVSFLGIFVSNFRYSAFAV
jgi:hypothetical protein